MSTIADVARAAGVSPSTVSYVLSGNRPISQETRERVEAAIRDLKFAPHAGARALKTAQTKVLGLFFHVHEDEFAPAMLEYVLPIAASAREAGFDVLLATESDGAAALHRITSAGMVDGVVLLDVTHQDPRLAALRAARVPGTLIGVPAEGAALDVLDLDFGEAARLLVDELHESGHRDVVLVTQPERAFARGAASAWRFRDAAVERAAGLGMRLTVHFGRSQQPAVAQNLNAVLDGRADATAAIVHNDASIAALPTVLRDRGVVVPRDLSVVSLYSQHFGRAFSLAYTTVETDPDRLGRWAVTRLLQRMGGDPSDSVPVPSLMVPQLVVRGSVGPPAR